MTNNNEIFSMLYEAYNDLEELEWGSDEYDEQAEDYYRLERFYITNNAINDDFIRYMALRNDAGSDYESDEEEEEDNTPPPLYEEITTPPPYNMIPPPPYF